MIQLLRDENVWQEVMNKFIKSDAFTVEEKLCLSVLKNKRFYDDIIDSIQKGTFEWSIPNKVEIPKSNGKTRTIYIHDIKDRFLLSVMNKIFTRQFDNQVSKYVYSYKEDLRTLSAIQALIQDKKLFDKYAMKLDISAYFNSVSQKSLNSVITEISKGDTTLYQLLYNLLFTNKTSYKNKIVEEYMSLIPGCAFSSFLANYTLKDLDEKIGSMEGITYARYSDDMIFFADDKSKFEPILEIVLAELQKYGLEINPDKYEYFDVGEPFEFLGLKVYKDLATDKPVIDIKRSGFNKMKKYIKSEVKYRRKKIDMEGSNPEIQLSKFFYDLNSKLYKTYIYDPSRFGWAYYVFNNVNTIETLRLLDFYLKERARYLYTGKNNKNNLNRISDEKLRQLGMRSFVEMYQYFKLDMDLYKTEVREIDRVFVSLIKEENHV